MGGGKWRVEGGGYGGWRVEDEGLRELLRGVGGSLESEAFWGKGLRVLRFVQGVGVGGVPTPGHKWDFASS